MQKLIKYIKKSQNNQKNVNQKRLKKQSLQVPISSGAITPVQNVAIVVIVMHLVIYIVAVTK